MRSLAQGRPRVLAGRAAIGAQQIHEKVLRGWRESLGLECFDCLVCLRLCLFPLVTIGQGEEARDSTAPTTTRAA